MTSRSVLGLLRLVSVILCLGACALSAEEADQPSPADIEFFEKRVRPVLSERCWDCHGKDNAESELRLDELAAILRGGLQGPAINLKQPERSLMLLAVNHADRLHMPPRSKIPQREIDALTEWVKRGAPWPGVARPQGIPVLEWKEQELPPEARSFWAFRPVSDPPPPKVERLDWCRSPLDRFVLARLEQAGLSPAPKASKRALIRRATYDLTGLPPTPEEVAAFLADDKPGAFARVVDRLLASPHYGQRWGRHWLDVVRYGDSNGLDENLAFAHAWRYRDYVIEAFNQDLPYHTFLQEQIAGDLLPEPASEDVQLRRIVATGFLCLGAKMLAEDDPVKMEMDIIDEQLDTLGKATMAMTLGCARCHEHKFDPISMGDYYALAGIFKSTRTMENFTVVARWQERPVATSEAIAHRDRIRQQIDELQAKTENLIQQERNALLNTAREQFREYLLAGARQVSLQRLLAKRGPQIQQNNKTLDPARQLIEAEHYDRGNVLKETSNYGKGIGVLVNRGETPNVVEYDIHVPASGLYQLDIRYAAAMARPCRLLVDGHVIRSDAAGKVTGSWYPDTQTWFAEAIFPLSEGAHRLRLEHPTFFPHIDKLLLSPVPDAEAILTEPRFWKIDDATLLPGILHACAQLSKSNEKEQGGPFQAWRFLLAHGTLEGYSGTTELEGFLLAAPRPETLSDLADRYNQAHQSKDHSAELKQVLNKKGGPFHPETIPESAFSEEVREQIAMLRQKSEQQRKTLPNLPEAMAVSEGEPQDLRIHLRGNHLTLGAKVRRRFPKVLELDSTPVVPSESSGRLELAQWLTDPRHPLTARVLVNRVWQHHFGHGLVRTPDHFGNLGERPTHPELLDWLATRFVKSGWSIKSLHRLILCSSAWQQSTAWNPKAAQQDPENRLLWRMNRRRLEAEPLRDALLSVGGLLDEEMQGSLLPTKNRAYVTSTANVNPEIYNTRRRTVYLPVIRSAVHDYLAAFDFGDPSVMRGRRDETTVAPQALFLMNSQVVAQASQALADRLLSERTNNEDRVELLFELLFSRSPTKEERHKALQFIQDDGLSWKSLCRALMMTNEFLYLD